MDDGASARRPRVSNALMAVCEATAVAVDRAVACAGTIAAAAGTVEPGRPPLCITCGAALAAAQASAYKNGHEPCCSWSSLSAAAIAQWRLRTLD